MLKTVFTFQLRPTSVSKEILSYDAKTKDIVTVSIIILYFLSSQILAYSLLPELYLSGVSTVSILKWLVLSFVWFYAYNFWVMLFGQLLSWWGSFRDICLVTAYSMFIYVILNPIVSIAGKLLWLWIFAGIGTLIPLIWFLVVYSKSLARVQDFSESKVLVNVIVVAVVFYFLSKYLLPIIGL